MKKRIISVLVIMALLAALAPITVYAATVTGQGKGGNTAPTVDAVGFVVGWRRYPGDRYESAHRVSGEGNHGRHQHH